MGEEPGVEVRRYILQLSVNFERGTGAYGSKISGKRQGNEFDGRSQIGSEMWLPRTHPSGKLSDESNPEETRLRLNEEVNSRLALCTSFRSRS